MEITVIFPGRYFFVISLYSFLCTHFLKCHTVLDIQIQRVLISPPCFFMGLRWTPTRSPANSDKGASSALLFPYHPGKKIALPGEHLKHLYQLIGPSIKPSLIGCIARRQRWKLNIFQLWLIASLPCVCTTTCTSAKIHEHYFRVSLSSWETRDFRFVAGAPLKMNGESLAVCRAHNGWIKPFRQGCFIFSHI